MIKKCLLLSFLFIPYAASGSDKVVENLSNFIDGENTNHLPDKIKASQVQDGQNVRFDKNLGVTRRDGLNSSLSCLNISSQGARGLWSYIGPTGTEWLILLDSSNLTATQSSACSVVIISSGLPTSVPTRAKQGLGKIWFTSITSGLASWDETTYVSYFATAPKAAVIDFYRNRIVLGGIVNNQSSIQLSGELNGSDFASDVRFSTSPMSIPVGGVNDGDKVQFVLSTADEVLLGKQRSLYALSGNDQRDFQVRQIANDVGSVYPDAAVAFGIGAILLTNRGLDLYTPPPQQSITRISEPIQNLMGVFSANSALPTSLLITSKSQWDTWTSVPTGNISTTQEVGSIKVGNKTFLDDTITDFAGDGTTFKYLPAHSSNFGSFASGNIFIGDKTADVSLDNGAIFANSENSDVSSRIFDSEVSSPVWATFYSSGNDNRDNYIKTSTFSDISLDSSTNVDFGSNQPWWGTPNTGLAPFLFIGSGTPSGGNSLIYSTNTARLNIPRKRYAQLYLDRTSVGGTHAIGLGTICTGYITSPPLDVGIAISSWGTLIADYSTNGGTITIQAQTSPNGVFSDTAWVTQIPNAQIVGIAPRSYLGFKLIFDSSSPINVPVVKELTINWINANSIANPVAVSYLDSFKLFYSTVSTGNNRGLIWDKNRAFAIDFGTYISAATVYKNTVYGADGRSNGKVYSVETNPYEDAGSQITSYTRFRRVDFGYPDRIKNFSKFYLTISRADASLSHIFSVKYYVDGGTTAYSSSNVELSTGTTEATLLSAIPITNFKQGYSIDVRVDEISFGTSPYTIHGLRCYAYLEDDEN